MSRNYLAFPIADYWAIWRKRTGKVLLNDERRLGHINNMHTPRACTQGTVCLVSLCRAVSSQAAVCTLMFIVCGLVFISYFISHVLFTCQNLEDIHQEAVINKKCEPSLIHNCFPFLVMEGFRIPKVTGASTRVDTVNSHQAGWFQGEPCGAGGAAMVANLWVCV